MEFPLVRVFGDDLAGEGLDLVEAREVGCVCAQLVRLDARGGDEAVRGGAGLVGRTAVQQHGGAALGELPGGLLKEPGAVHVVRGSLPQSGGKRGCRSLMPF
ncbi:hypothetical protein EDD90_2352 [Streptomyces sp. Ag109_O5-1]|uniref:hypothetical protein n=1 Tax=Streptomyces sp. Ag109_O5-1 TaxID=1938851 RepID=UPI000FA1AE52|nr:hypothetical protein EDD90_2352 [Streptomyces sp. Ag109_O5-1]